MPASIQPCFSTDCLSIAIRGRDTSALLSGHGVFQELDAGWLSRLCVEGSHCSVQRLQGHQCLKGALGGSASANGIARGGLDLQSMVPSPLWMHTHAVFIHCLLCREMYFKPCPGMQCPDPYTGSSGVCEAESFSDFCAFKEPFATR